eukprot:6501216-Alexandrium_andersonii.AAC.1
MWVDVAGRGPELDTRGTQRRAVREARMAAPGGGSPGVRAATLQWELPRRQPGTVPTAAERSWPMRRAIMGRI